MKDFADNHNLKTNIKDKDLFRRLMGFATCYKLQFIIIFILIIVMVLIDLVPPIIVGEIINLLKNGTTDFNIILLLSGGYFICLVFSSILNYMQAIKIQKTGQSILFNIRSKVFTKIESLSIGQINHIPIGKLVTRVTNDTNTLNQMYTQVSINIFKNVFTIIGVVIAMFIYNVRVTLFVLSVLPIIFLISLIFRYYARRAHRLVRSNLSNINAFLSENLSLMKIIQGMNQQRKQYGEFKEKSDKLKKSYIQEIIIFGIFRPLIYLLNIGSTILILYIGSILVMDEVVELGIISTFSLYIQQLFQPLQQLSEQFNVLQSSFAAAERIFDVLDTEPTVKNNKDGIKVDKLRGEIEFKNVWFAYENENWILKDVSFKVNEGETVAFVGATGSGKTTILNLIVRNYDIQKGQILIDGIDIKEYDIDSLRKNIGQMLQDVFLFSGTIKANIKLKDDSITDKEVVEAVKYVNAEFIIDKLENGYDTIVKERGSNFSTGERQLLSFARVIAHKPSVMILDEATSNIDTETEQVIQESLQKMMNIGTMLVVAHRLSTIQHADKIILLSHGEIKEVGNHQELLKKKGMYYNLYRLQYE
ncbi:TPA: ABC transporter ATP-binding protein [bacterium]|nr:ABC transporter ATP-binding protein [bacterium]